MYYLISRIGLYGLSEFEKEALLKLILASVCGGLIGIEREMKGRPAGLRTFSLVCVGATLAMITNEYIFTRLGGVGDATRMGAQVISGIGFLGAGTIMVTSHNHVRGLTTAATLWVTASIGIAIGAGFYFGSIVSVVVIFIALTLFWMIDKKIMAKSRFMRIYVEAVSEEFMLDLAEYYKNNGIRVLNLTRRSESKWYKNDACAMIEMDFGKRREHKQVLEDIRKMKDFRYVEEV